MPLETRSDGSLVKLEEWKWLVSKLKASWKLQMLGVLGLCGTSLLWLVDPLIIKWLIDVVLPARSVASLGVAVALLLAAFVGRFFMLIASLYTASLTGQHLILGLRRRLFAKLQRCSTQFFETHQIGDLSYLLEQDVDQVGGLGADIIPTLVRIILTALLTVGMMFRLNVILTLVVIVFLPIFIVLGVTFRRILQKAASQSRAAAGQRNSILLESLTGAVQIQLLGALLPISRRYVHGVGKALRANLGERRCQLAYSAASLCTIACATTVMLGFGGARVIHGALSIGGYVAFYTYLLRLFEPLNTAIDMHSRLQKGRVSIRKLMDLEALQPAFPETGRAGNWDVGPVQEIQYHDVSFEYASGCSVLRGVNLTLQLGDRLVLAGASGCGKSTLIKLLARLYEVPIGAILIDGVDIREIHVDDLRKRIGVVPQEPVLFEGTIRENLLIGRRRASESEILKAIHVACLEDVLAKRPEGLDCKLGQFGAGLSGGEKQRLAMARVVIQQRPILVLDEATSALDPHIKASVLSRLAEVTADKIVIVVSHDSMTKAWAGREVIVQEGRCVERQAEPKLPEGLDAQLIC